MFLRLFTRPIKRCFVCRQPTYFPEIHAKKLFHPACWDVFVREQQHL